MYIYIYNVYIQLLKILIRENLSEPMRMQFGLVIQVVHAIS